MFFSTRKRYVALAAPLLLFSVACSGEVATPTAVPPTATPTPSAAAPAETGNQVGNLAPNFTLVDVSTGQPVQLAELTEQGRPVVLYFFTTW